MSANPFGSTFFTRAARIFYPGPRAGKGAGAFGCRAKELNKDLKLTILAFPCNQFGAQEPGSASEIKSFVLEQGAPVEDSRSGFILMEKVDVNGPGTHPVYQFLKSSTGVPDIKWNFSAYFLVNSAGTVQHLPGGRNSPLSMKEAIEANRLHLKQLETKAFKPAPDESKGTDWVLKGYPFVKVR
ncbi:Glutathione peroxidase 1 [Durusdinium trenchii]|uniref:Glutathione peroxidase n=1 Tax=Durusdinium trenchii TaxID=1381693 RepID=A0ABP0RBW1_9DINO